MSVDFAPWHSSLIASATSDGEYPGPGPRREVFTNSQTGIRFETCIGTTCQPDNDTR